MVRSGCTVKKFLDWLTSMRLAIGLVVYLALASTLATLVPQGLEPEVYLANYPKLLAELIVQTGFSSFFGSILFIIPGFLFFANLSACTVKRFAREVKKTGRRRFGPDILHLGLMLLVIGAAVSYSGHKEGSVQLLPGEAVNLPDGSVLRLKDFRFERYDDGRPRDWVSVVSLSKGDDVIREDYEIRVNRPLRHAGLTLYQSTYQNTLALLVEDATGQYRLSPGEELTLSGIGLFFMGPEGSDPSGGAMAPSGLDGRAVLQVTDQGGQRVERLSAGQSIGPVRMVGFESRLATGIEAVQDPGYPLVVIALVLVALGTCVTFIQKAKEAA